MISKGQTTITISFDTLQKAKRIAKEERRSLSGLVEYCLMREIERHKKIKAIDEEMQRDELIQRRRAFSKAPRKDSTSR